MLCLKFTVTGVLYIASGRWLESNGLRELPPGIFDNNPDLETM